jgi:hypothetical protein
LSNALSRAPCSRQDVERRELGRSSGSEEADKSEGEGTSSDTDAEKGGAWETLPDPAMLSVLSGLTGGRR